MEKFERSNGTKIIDGNREKKFADLKQKVLTESIAHDDLVDKYTEVDLTQLTTFNLDKNKFNIQRELNQVELAASYYFDNPDNPNMLKSLAKLNGYVDKKGNANVNAFLNFYLPLIKSRNKG